MRPFHPMPLVRRPEPFDDPRWLFELKYDGFRALAFVERDRVTLVSRNGNVFKRFAGLGEAMRRELRVRAAVLDGEVVCVHGDGRPDFRALLFRRGTPRFVAFDILAHNGRDLRAWPLTRRKAALRRLVGSASAHVVYADHVRGTGRNLFRLVCAKDLEGIVAKPAASPYDVERPLWVKLKNRDYSQARDRHELFDQRTTRRRA